MAWAVCFSLLILMNEVLAYRDPHTAQSFIGSSVNQLIANWGEPDVRLTRPSGRVILVYKIVTSQTYNDQKSPAVGVNMAGNRPAIIVSGEPYQQQSNLNLKLICSVQFEATREGVIADSVTQGNGC